MTRRFFPLHDLDLPTSSKSGNCDLTKCAFKFLLLLKPVIGTSGNTFLCPSSDARITCKSSKIFLTFQITGWYVALKLILVGFSRLLTFSKSASLGIPLSRSISFRTIFSLEPLSNRYFSKSLHLLLKDSLIEQILLRLSVWLYGIPY